MKHVTCLLVCLLQSFSPEWQKHMDPSVVTTIRSAAVVAVVDVTEEATRSTADGGQKYVEGRSLMSQTNEDLQSEQGRQSNDGGTPDAPPHQVRQDESHGLLSIRPPGR